MELISRDELLKQIEKDSKGNEGQYGDEWLFIDTINSLPTIEERIEGKWIFMDSDDMRYDSYRCSNCWNEITVDPKRVCDIGFTIEDFNYCPNCGARMKGE